MSEKRTFKDELIQRLQKEVAELRTSKTEHTQKILLKEEEKNQLKRERDELKNELGTFKDDLVHILADYDKVKRDIEMLKQLNEELKKKVQTIVAEFNIDVQSQDSLGRNLLTDMEKIRKKLTALISPDKEQVRIKSLIRDACLDLD